MGIQFIPRKESVSNKKIPKYLEIEKTMIVYAFSKIYNTYLIKKLEECKMKEKKMKNIIYLIKNDLPSL